MVAWASRPVELPRRDGTMKTVACQRISFERRLGEDIDHLIAG
jgi:hypothetical protein